MKKKYAAILLSAVTAVSGMGGVLPVSAAEDGEITEIVWQWPSLGSTGSGFQAVEDALNAMTEPDIGVHITLEPVTFSELANETVLTVSSGEQLDLCLSVGTGVGNLVSSGLIEPLDDYIDNEGKDIKEKCGSALSAAITEEHFTDCPMLTFRVNLMAILQERIFWRNMELRSMRTNSIPWMNLQKFSRR